MGANDITGEIKHLLKFMSYEKVARHWGALLQAPSQPTKPYWPGVLYCGNSAGPRFLQNKSNILANRLCLVLQFIQVNGAKLQY